MNKTIKIALVGQPNVGKSMLINSISNSRLKVGNFSGVTVEKKEVIFKYKDYNIKIIDLPGSYSLENYSLEEKVVKNFLNQNEYDIILNVIDSTNLQRNLLLTSELLDLNKKMVIALNMSDEAKKENILITTGSQQAMYILAKFFENKDITIEEPSYLGAMNIFRLNSLKMDGVKLEDDGVNIKEFEKSFKKTKLTYLIPDFQNPSATTYSSEKREAVCNIVKKYDGILIEDSPYSELYFDKKSKYISASLPNNSFHLGSFSKTLVPSLRIGWIRADEEKIKSLLIIKESIDLHSCGLSQYILAQYLKDEVKYEKHLQEIRDDYKAKAQFFSQALKTIMPEFKHQTPKGGMFLYGGFEDKKIDTFSLVQEC